jgi:hypothetical protein
MTALFGDDSSAAFRYSRVPILTLWQTTPTTLLVFKRNIGASYSLHDACRMPKTMFEMDELLPPGMSSGNTPTLLQLQNGSLILHELTRPYYKITSRGNVVQRINAPSTTRRLLVLNGTVLAYELANASVYTDTRLLLEPEMLLQPQLYFVWDNITMAYDAGIVYMFEHNSSHYWLTPSQGAVTTACIQYITAYTSATFAEAMPESGTATSITSVLHAIVEKIQQDILLVLLLLGIPLLVIVIPLLILLLIFTMRLMQLFGIELDVGFDEN